MKSVWTINGEGEYPTLHAARVRALSRYPKVVWGNLHQGSNGRMRVVGRLTGEPNDLKNYVILEQVLLS